MAKKHSDIKIIKEEEIKEVSALPTPKKKSTPAKVEKLLSAKEFCGLRAVLPRFQFVAERKFGALGRKSEEEWVKLFEKEKVPHRRNAG